MKENLQFASILLIVICGCNSDHSASLEQFMGMWQLDKYEAFDSTTGKWNEAPKRIGYSGFILYDGTGHMGVQLVPPGFNDLNDSTSVDSLTIDALKQNVTLQSKMFVYFGNCEILDEQNVIEHHIQSSNHPDEIGTTVSRKYEFKGDTLILTAAERISGSKTRLRWIKYRGS